MEPLPGVALKSARQGAGFSLFLLLLLLKILLGGFGCVNKILLSFISDTDDYVKYLNL